MMHLWLDRAASEAVHHKTSNTKILLDHLAEKNNAKDARNLHSCMQCQEYTTTEIESWDLITSTMLVPHMEGGDQRFRPCDSQTHQRLDNCMSE